MSSCQVVFTPSGRRGEVLRGTTVLEAARILGVDLDTVCGGRGICGRCQVVQGTNPAVPFRTDAFSPPGPTETEYRGRRPLADGARLGCATAILSDVVVDVPPESQIHRQVIRKRPEVENFPIDPLIRLYYVELSRPELTDARADIQRVEDALRQEWGLGSLSFEPQVMESVHSALVGGAWSVTVAVRSGVGVIAVWPGFRDRLLGVAFDIGSTTIAGHLLDLSTGQVLASAGKMNPQIRYGEDLMSRVSHVMLDPEGSTQMTGLVRGALNELVAEITDQAGADPFDVLDVTLVGNPIMHHLFLGLDPRPLGEAPFAPVIRRGIDMRAADAGLQLHPGARLHVLPLVAGHVGADTMGAILSEGPHRTDSIQLLVDVGTNAEIVLGSRAGLLAASSPTGPAFEGAQISSGQRATPGAIERVRIDPETLQPRIRLVAIDVWSDEDGFDEATRKTGVTGICGSGIIEGIAELFLAGVIDVDGVIQPRGPRVVAEGRTHSYVLWEEPEIRITQKDVRAVQLAKAALYAGVKLLMDRAGIAAVDEIRLAGAFGSHIDPKYAMVLGLIPDCDLSAVAPAGNAAGSGAIMALLSAGARDEARRLAEDIQKVETATEPRFQEHFVAAMGIPNSVDTFPNLSRELGRALGGVVANTPRTRRRERSRG